MDGFLDFCLNSCPGLDSLWCGRSNYCPMLDGLLANCLNSRPMLYSFVAISPNSCPMLDGLLDFCPNFLHPCWTVSWLSTYTLCGFLVLCLVPSLVVLFLSLCFSFMSSSLSVTPPSIRTLVGLFCDIWGTVRIYVCPVTSLIFVFPALPNVSLFLNVSSCVTCPYFQSPQVFIIMLC